MEKIALGFSGGVDSAVAAKRLMDAGYSVVGLFLDVGVHGAREDAIRTAAYLNLPLEIWDRRDELSRLVCQPFIEGYLQGRTLNPCLLCNPVMKLRALTEYADEMGAPWIATGHYAVVKDGALYAGRPQNDQSYQLCRITNEQLNRLILPLGAVEKRQVRTEAKAAGIPIACKPDSMDICFVPDHDYAAWLERQAPMPGAGDAVYNGTVVGRHGGIHHFTVGQRWGETENGRRLYVTAIHPETNRLELALWEDTFAAEVRATAMNWLVPAPKAPFRAQVRVRHTRWEMPNCDVTPTASGVIIRADSPFRAPARGQTAAIYVDGQVVGAGEIASASPGLNEGKEHSHL
ncbi:MAG: tRNA 2-thiouridine(34) synthase MnmA [Eubacteriales bacterium]|nr:tRNA 2-thiouridine(34) synthase MnmA [Eubacteriales bacterium]